MSEVDYRVRYPDHFDDDEWEIVSKGWFNGLAIETPTQTFRPTFFDLARLNQEFNDSLEALGYHAEKNLVLIRTVDRAHIDAAVQGMDERGFAELRPE